MTMPNDTKSQSNGKEAEGTSSKHRPEENVEDCDFAEEKAPVVGRESGEAENIVNKEDSLTATCTQDRTDGVQNEDGGGGNDGGGDDGGDEERQAAVEGDVSLAGSADSMVESGIEMDPSDDEDVGDTSGLSGEERNQLFARGLSHEKEGRREAALKCYTGCLSGLSKETRFVLLPQCLRNIAEIYYQNQEYDKAIHFIQAEKLYYENALINTEEIQKKLEELTGSRGEEPQPGRGEPDMLVMETLRAEEYEHLAKLCMDKKQPELALEYAGKCTKLRQQLFGERHPKTQESLDLFASLYAEVGKLQYNDSLQTLDSPTDSSDAVPTLTDSQDSLPSTPTGDSTPVSILRNRKNSEREKKQVRFHESVVDNSYQRVQEEWVSRTVVAALLVICMFFLVILGLGLYCRGMDSQVCRSVVESLHSAYLQLRYQYYKYTSTKHVKFA
ncbi:hypothetical protein ACOMHN_051839 [Nucella lapillus]